MIDDLFPEDLIENSEVLNNDIDVNKFLVDVEQIKTEIYLEAKNLISNNKNAFSKENVVSKSEYAWLKSVDTILLKPESEDITLQQEQLNLFIDKLKTKCFFLKTKHLPNILPEEYNEPILGFDTETTGLDVRTLYDIDGNLDPQTELVGISLAPTENEGYYLPVRHTQEDNILNWNTKVIAEFLTRLNKEFCLIIHNSVYDRQVIALARAKEFRSYPYFFDTMILYYLLSTDSKKYGLKHLSETLLNRKMIDIWDMFPKDDSNDFIRFDFLPASNAYIYACSDATNTLFLFKKLFENKSQTNPLFFQSKPMDIDHKFVDALICMCRAGFPVDVFYSINALKDLILRVKLLESDIYKLVGKKFNIGSGKQLSEILFNDLKIPPLPSAELNKNNYYSVDESALTELQKKYPQLKFLEYIITYRNLTGSVSKYYGKFIKNSYVDGLNPITRLMLSFSMVNVPTSRLASSSRGELEHVVIKEGKKTISKKFVSSKGECGVNSQAIPSDRYELKNCKVLEEVPQEILELSNKLDDSIELDFFRTLCSGKADIESL